MQSYLQTNGWTDGWVMKPQEATAPPLPGRVRRQPARPGTHFPGTMGKSLTTRLFSFRIAGIPAVPSHPHRAVRSREGACSYKTMAAFWNKVICASVYLYRASPGPQVLLLQDIQYVNIQTHTSFCDSRSNFPMSLKM